MNQSATFANLSVNLPDFEICQSISWSVSQADNHLVNQGFALLTRVNQFLKSIYISDMLSVLL